MIEINKFFNPDINPIKMAAEIGIRLKHEKSIPAEELMSEFMNKYRIGGAHIFSDALAILYVTGKVEYNKDNDSLEHQE